MASAIAAAERVVAHVARIRYRLLLVNVLVAAVPLVGIAFAELHESQLLAGLERDMIHQGQLVRAVIAAEPGRPLADREAMLRAAARQTRTRIRLLDATATVVVDSHRIGPPEGAEPPPPQLVGSSEPRAPEVPKPIAVADRREIRAALAGRYGAATRLWGSEGRVYLFAALPIQRGAAAPVTGIVYVTKSTTDVQQKLYRLRTWLVRLLAGTIAVTTLISLLLATTIARPLGQLTRRAQRVAAREPVDDEGRLATRRDEIGQLARALDTMTAELERRTHDARTLAADISHELKTPLAGIRGAAELLRDGAGDDPEIRDRFLAMIVADAARIDRDLARLLELARAEDDRAEPAVVDLAALVADCATRSWPCPVTVRNPAVTCSEPKRGGLSEIRTSDHPPAQPLVRDPADPRVTCSEPKRGDLSEGRTAAYPSGRGRAALVRGRSTQLAAAIENLVANATQHAAAGTGVGVTIEERGDHVRVAVANHGAPLSATAQRQVWDRFYTTRTAAGGTGLGLAIVRSVALAHGGRVGVTCADGVTTFWFEVRARATIVG